MNPMNGYSYELEISAVSKGPKNCSASKKKLHMTYKKVYCFDRRGAKFCVSGVNLSPTSPLYNNIIRFIKTNISILQMRKKKKNLSFFSSPFVYYKALSSLFFEGLYGEEGGVESELLWKYTSAAIGACKCNLPSLSGNYDRQANRATKRPSDGQNRGIGKLSLPIKSELENKS